MRARLALTKAMGRRGSVELYKRYQGSAALKRSCALRCTLMILDRPASPAIAIPVRPTVQCVVVALTCAVRSQLGAEDGAGASYFILDD